MDEISTSPVWLTRCRRALVVLTAVLLAVSFLPVFVASPAAAAEDDTGAGTATPDTQAASSGTSEGAIAVTPVQQQICRTVDKCTTSFQRQCVTRDVTAVKTETERQCTTTNQCQPTCKQRSAFGFCTKYELSCTAQETCADVPVRKSVTEKQEVCQNVPVQSCKKEQVCSAPPKVSMARIYYSTNPNDPRPTFGGMALSGANPTTAVRGLTPGTVYYFWVSYAKAGDTGAMVKESDKAGRVPQLVAYSPTTTAERRTCAVGFVLVGNACRKTEVGTPACPTGATMIDGKCYSNAQAQQPRCPAGSVATASGQCFRNGRAVESTCRRGFNLVGGVCRKSVASTTVCARGSWSQSLGLCVFEQAATRACPAGTTLSGGQCREVRATDVSWIPRCTGQGSTSDCYEQSSVNRCPSGWNWNGSQCTRQVPGTETINATTPTAAANAVQYPVKECTACEPYLSPTKDKRVCYPIQNGTQQVCTGYKTVRQCYPVQTGTRRVCYPVQTGTRRTCYPVAYSCSSCSTCTRCSGSGKNQSCSSYSCCSNSTCYRESCVNEAVWGESCVNEAVWGESCVNEQQCQGYRTEPTWCSGESCPGSCVWEYSTIMVDRWKTVTAYECPAGTLPVNANQDGSQPHTCRGAPQCSAGYTLTFLAAPLCEPNNCARCTRTITNTETRGGDSCPAGWVVSARSASNGGTLVCERAAAVVQEPHVTCAAGFILSGSECVRTTPMVDVCPAGTTQKTQGNQQVCEERIAGTPTCDAGFTLSGSSCIQDEQAGSQCKPGESLIIADGQMLCASAPVKAEMVCPAGSYQVGDKCFAALVAPQSCPAGFAYNATTNKCERSAEQAPAVNPGISTCGSDTVLRNGVCVPRR